MYFKELLCFGGIEGAEQEKIVESRKRGWVELCSSSGSNKTVFHFSLDTAMKGSSVTNVIPAVLETVRETEDKCVMSRIRKHFPLWE